MEVGEGGGRLVEVKVSSGKCVQLRCYSRICMRRMCAVVSEQREGLNVGESVAVSESLTLHVSFATACILLLVCSTHRKIPPRS